MCSWGRWAGQRDRGWRGPIPGHEDGDERACARSVRRGCAGHGPRTGADVLIQELEDFTPAALRVTAGALGGAFTWRGGSIAGAGRRVAGQRALVRLKRDESKLADSMAITAIATIPSPIMLTALMRPSSHATHRDARDGNLRQAWIIGT